MLKLSLYQRYYNPSELETCSISASYYNHHVQQTFILGVNIPKITITTHLIFFLNRP